MKTNLQNELTLTDRLTGPMSKFFQPLVKGGVILAALSAGLLAKGVKILGYVSGAVCGVSKLTVDLEGGMKCSS